MQGSTAVVASIFDAVLAVVVLFVAVVAPKRLAPLLDQQGEEISFLQWTVLEPADWSAVQAEELASDVDIRNIERFEHVIQGHVENTAERAFAYGAPLDVDHGPSP